MTGVLKLMIPGHLAFKDLMKMFESGDFTDLILYGKKEEPGDKTRGRRPKRDVSKEMKSRAERRKKRRK